MAKRPGGVMVQGTEATRSQLIPVITKWQEIGKKAQLGPVIFCIAAFFALQFFGSTDPIAIPMGDGSGNVGHLKSWIYTSWFLTEVAFLLTAISFYFIYRVVGKSKSWWILLAAFAFVAYFIWLMTMEGDFGWLYEFFHVHLAGETRGNARSFVQWVVGTGFFEEFVKAIPVFILVVVTPYMSPSLRAKFGVEEPLDGILIGCAAAGGFAIAETVLQYLSQELVIGWLETGRNIIQTFGLKDTQILRDPNIQALIRNYPHANVEDVILLIGQRAANTTIGMPGLIIRSIDQAFGHMAYSGYFGYFIGLSVMRPAQRWKWVDLQAEGETDLGQAFALLAEDLSQLPQNTRMLPPQIVLISDGKPTDDWRSALQVLLNVPWGKRAVRQAIAIGQDADHETLRKFVDNPERPVLRVDNAEQLVRYFRYVSTSVTATPPGKEAPPPTPQIPQPAYDDSAW